MQPAIDRPCSEEIKPLIRDLLSNSERPCAAHIAGELTESGYPVSAALVSREAYSLGIRLRRGRLPGCRDRLPRKRRSSDVRDEVARLYALDPKALSQPGAQAEIARRLNVSRQAVQWHVSAVRRGDKKSRVSVNL